MVILTCGLSLGLVIKNLHAVRRHRRPGSDSPGPKDLLEEENGNPLQYSCIKNLMDGGTWQTTVHRVTKSIHD